MSNAENEPIFRLSLRATILSPINVSRRFDYLKSIVGAPYSGNLELSTELKGFKVTSVYYIKRGSPDTTNISYNVESKGVDSSGYNSYLVTYLLERSNIDIEAGSIFFETNHPKVPKIEVRTMLERVNKENDE